MQFIPKFEKISQTGQGTVCDKCNCSTKYRNRDGSFSYDIYIFKEKRYCRRCFIELCKFRGVDYSKIMKDTSLLGESFRRIKF